MGNTLSVRERKECRCVIQSSGEQSLLLWKICLEFLIDGLSLGFHRKHVYRMTSSHTVNGEVNASLSFSTCCCF